MIILAIDTTANTSSIAVVSETEIIGEFTINYKKTHSQTLMPMIEHLLKTIEIDISDIDFVACSCGPGSFTGLRIGGATAKAIAHGAGIPIVPVPTLDSLAYNIFEEKKLIVPIMDARRNQVYSAIYEKKNEKIERLTEYMAEDIEEVLNMVKNYEKEAIFLGDGVTVFREAIEREKYSIPPINMRLQKGSSVGVLAIDLINEKKYVKYNELSLIYIRKSQAEREYERRLENAQSSAI